MNPKTSQTSDLIIFYENISFRLLFVGESLPSSFPYILIGPINTTPAMSSSTSTTMVSSTPPPFSYFISSTRGVSVLAPPGASTHPSASSLSGLGTTDPFGVGSTPHVGTRVSSTTAAIPSISITIHGTFSL